MTKQASISTGGHSLADSFMSIHQIGSVSYNNHCRVGITSVHTNLYKNKPFPPFIRKKSIICILALGYISIFDKLDSEIITTALGKLSIGVISSQCPLLSAYLYCQMILFTINTVISFSFPAGEDKRGRKGNGRKIIDNNDRNKY